MILTDFCLTSQGACDKIPFCVDILTELLRPFLCREVAE